MFEKRIEINPTIYAYSVPTLEYKGLLKIGYTTIGAETRVKQQFNIKGAGAPLFNIELEESAMRNDGAIFTDKDVHRFLKKNGYVNLNNSEWFRCDVSDVKRALASLRLGQLFDLERVNSFQMRPEQEKAVTKTSNYFNSFKDQNERTPHFLWNAKMRFGKTFASYQLALKQGWNKVLILTFKPAVQSAWEEDLLTHIDFQGWQFVTKDNMNKQQVDHDKPIVCFGSFQDFLGKNELGGIKAKNEWVHKTNWDCVILDEYHYGAWRESAKDLFEGEEKNEILFGDGIGREYFDEEKMPIKTRAYLYLSGTPFRAIETGEFIEEQIYNWTYSDEQRAKREWKGDNNPYASLPKMVLLTYQLPSSIREIASKGEFDEFNLNTFFAAEGNLEDAKFKYEDDVQKWLDLIRGAYLGNKEEMLKLSEKPPLPFSDSRLLSALQHTFWFLPSVASCFAMRNLISKRNNSFYHEYRVIVAAGSAAGLGVKAIDPVLTAMDNPVKTKTITLSCGKLTTGVSIKPWSGILILRDTSSPETYFQAAFRVQTPWTIKDPEELSPNKEIILKNECYVFDFAPDRALRQIADYSCRLNINESNTEKKVHEFINFLPVLAFDGSSMKQLDAAGILDIAMSGTTATLLARRWESPLLVNVDNNVLANLLQNERALEALMSIEGFRNVNKDIQTIINKSDIVKQKQKEANNKEIPEKEKKEIKEAEKEYKTLRKQIQDKLIKFITRIPIFMYLTDYREHTLKDVIEKIEPELFYLVTGLDKDDFELLISLGLFNPELLNDAVYKFKRYEDSSLAYSGIIRQNNGRIGGWDTIIEY